MKKRYYILLSAVILCLCIAFAYRTLTPTQEPFEHTITGYLVNQDDAGQPCEVRISGTRNTYPKFSTNSNSIRFVDCGGVYLDGIPLAIDHFVFTNKEDDFAIMTISGVGTFLMSREGNCIIGVLKNDLSETILLAPAASREDAMILIEQLESQLQTESSARFFEEVRTYLET